MVNITIRYCGVFAALHSTRDNRDNSGKISRKEVESKGPAKCRSAGDVGLWIRRIVVWEDIMDRTIREIGEIGIKTWRCTKEKRFG